MEAWLVERQKPTQILSVLCGLLCHLRVGMSQYFWRQQARHFRPSSRASADIPNAQGNVRCGNAHQAEAGQYLPWKMMSGDSRCLPCLAVGFVHNLPFPRSQMTGRQMALDLVAKHTHGTLVTKIIRRQPLVCPPPSADDGPDQAWNAGPSGSASIVSQLGHSNQPR